MSKEISKQEGKLQRLHEQIQKLNKDMARPDYDTKVQAWRLLQLCNLWCNVVSRCRVPVILICVECV